jgi:hypothetical protein
MHMQLHALNGITETIAALKAEAAGYRTQARNVSDTVPLLRQALKRGEYQLRQVLQDGESSSNQIRGARSAVSRARMAVDQAISEAMLLDGPGCSTRFGPGYTSRSDSGCRARSGPGPPC